MQATLSRHLGKKPSSFAITWALIGLATAGLALSIHLTTDTRWLEWHLSRLGEGDHLSSAIFNFTMGTAAVILGLVGTRLSEELAILIPQSGARTLRNIFLLTALCWVGVACFPFDKFPVIHNIFGYSEAFLLMSAMLGLKTFYPTVTRRTYWLGIGTTLCISVLLLVFSLTHIPTMLIIELTGQVLLFTWLLSLTYEVRQRRLQVSI